MDLSPLTQALVGAAASAVTLLAGGLLAMLPRLWTYAAVRINGAEATLLPSEHQPVDGVRSKDALRVRAQRALPSACRCRALQRRTAHAPASEPPAAGRDAFASARSWRVRGAQRAPIQPKTQSSLPSERPAGEDEDEARQEGEEGDDHGRCHARGGR